MALLRVSCWYFWFAVYAFLVVFGCESSKVIDDAVVTIQKDGKSYAIENTEVYDPSKSHEVDNHEDEDTQENLENTDATGDQENTNSEESTSDGNSSESTDNTDESSTNGGTNNQPNTNSKSKSESSTSSNKGTTESQNTPANNGNGNSNLPRSTVSNYINIPDTSFRDVLKILIPEAFDGQDRMDANHHAVKQLKDLDIRGKSISSVEGIEYLTGLAKFKCDGNELKTLDLRTNTQLVELRCSKNKLTSLDLSNNTNLETLFCYSNKLTSLDLSNNTSLKRISLRGNKLEQLDIRTITLGAKKLTLNAYDGSSNQLKELRIHDGMKQYEEVIEAKTRGKGVITILTYSDDGSQSCANWNPPENKCTN